MEEPTIEAWGRLTESDRDAILRDEELGPYVLGWKGNGVPIVRGNYLEFCRKLAARAPDDGTPRLKRKRGRPPKRKGFGNVESTTD